MCMLNTASAAPGIPWREEKFFNQIPKCDDESRSGQNILYHT